VLQHLRRYATEAPKAANNTAVYGGVAAAAAGVGGWYMMNRGGAVADAPPSKDEAQNIPAQAGDRAVKCFKGGDQGFVSLVLQDIQEINHNTKRLRFHLPEEDSVSGLNVACKSREMRPYTYRY